MSTSHAPESDRAHQSHDSIAVVDFGGQYAHLIATKVRRLHVRAEILQPDDPIEKFAGYRGIIFSGSPSLSAHSEGADYTHAIFDLAVPILGFCFGHQEIAKRYGGTVIHGGREWGAADLHILPGEAAGHALLAGLSPVERVFMSHFDSVTSVGPDFIELGWSRLGEQGEEHRFAAIASDKHRRYGFQFHPEVDDTEHGSRMIGNFVLGICGCAPSWTMERYLDEQVATTRAQVGDQSVFLLASGGVDSTVAAKIFALALGPDTSRLRLLHVDNGLMRKDESRQVMEALGALGLGDAVQMVDASDDFLAALEGLVEPEAKRRAIGDTFVRVFEREAERLGISHHLLGQGTIYPDTIETGGTRRADTIKTHHNRVPIIEEMIRAGRVVEPLADLYKVEVRELGQRLGVPHDLLWRHPFPGPGLGVRCLCSTGIDDGKAALLAPTVSEMAARFGLGGAPLPIRSVGVKADLRSYEHPVMLWGRASAKVPEDTVLEASSLLLRSVEGINRCILRLDGGEPIGARPVAATMTRARLDLLREADHIVMEALRAHELYDVIWQCPTVLVPLALDAGEAAAGGGSELVIIRPIRSERGMTATAAWLPQPILDELATKIGALPGVSAVALDLTSKPPGTIEWE